MLATLFEVLSSEAGNRWPVESIGDAATAIHRLAPSSQRAAVGTDPAAWLTGKPAIRVPCRTVTADGTLAPLTTVWTAEQQIASTQGTPTHTRRGHFRRQPARRHTLTWTDSGLQVHRSHGQASAVQAATLAALAGDVSLCLLAVVYAAGTFAMPQLRAFDDPEIAGVGSAVRAITAARNRLLVGVA